MCGIAGIVSENPAHISKQLLRNMTDAIAHRGPDGEGHWINVNNSVGFGHRRLAIIDLSDAAAQPMHYGDRYTIVHNGEIYNYLELRKLLEQKYYRFRTQSDTEIIMAAYDCWKEDCLGYFDGMFAFALWDEKEQKLFAARDRFGEKPFYYALKEGSLYFASEMKALWAAGIERIPNQALVYNYLTLGYTQNPADAGVVSFLNIHKLPAGCYFHYSNNNKEIRVRKYWDIDPEKQIEITEEKAIEKFGSLLSQSVKVRLRADVNMGTSLSGGLDSSSILSLVNALTEAGKKPVTFSAVFPGYEKDESIQIRAITEKLGVKNYQVEPTAENFLQQFDKLCYHQEELFQSASIYAQYEVFKLAHEQQVKVLLDGQGADEVLAGYPKYYHWYWQELYASNRTLLNSEMQQAKSLGIDESWTWKNKLFSLYPGSAATFLSRRMQAKQRTSDFLTKDFIKNWGNSFYKIPPGKTLNDVLYYNAFVNGLEELLRYADRNSMAHGREVRLPFLHHELVEFVFSLPAHFKIRNGYTKWILRHSMDNNLPDQITWQPNKIGFEPPQQKWMNHPLFQEKITGAKNVLVKEKILKASVLDKRNQPHDAYAADGFDWRILVAKELLFP